MAEITPKPWFKSKTLWANTILAATTALTANLTLLEPLMGPAFYVAMICLIASINVFLRLLTTSPIAGAEVITGVAP